MKFKKFDYKKKIEKRGSLLAIDFKKLLKIRIKRIFFISGNKIFTRGNHAHKKCIQCFIQLRGKCLISLSSKNKSKKIILNDKKRSGIIVYPKTWIKIKFYSKNNLTLALCSHEYDNKDYIKKFQNL